ncbi:hypothetical protein NL676_021859 [Syzygium grande]|nr:hypothetical protein NL676_021859 [Syzygium grande]
MEPGKLSSESSSEESDPIEQPKEEGSVKRSYECTFCKRGFTNAQALGGHMNIHRKDRAKGKQAPSASPTMRKIYDPYVISSNHIGSKSGRVPPNYDLGKDDEAQRNYCHKVAADPNLFQVVQEEKVKTNASTQTQRLFLSFFFAAAAAVAAMCTLEKRGDVFYLTLTGSDEHRLSPTLIASLLSALAEAASQSTRGSVLVTTSAGKFFSNGFDLAWAQSAGSPDEAQRRLHQMVEEFKPVVAALISLPMPTIAAVQGHAAAAGLLLALSHDYVVMRSDRGVLYMSEVDIGLSLPDYFGAVLRAKVGSAAARREVVLRGRKVRGGGGGGDGDRGGGARRRGGGGGGRRAAGGGAGGEEVGRRGVRRDKEGIVPGAVWCVGVDHQSHRQS